jgi:predicted nucleotidyltransferase
MSSASVRIGVYEFACDLDTVWWQARAITASAGPGGVIAPSGRVIVGLGTSPVFTMTPNPGYTVKDVLVDGVSVGKMASYTFPNVQDHHTIAAAFEPLTVGFGDIAAGLRGMSQSFATWADYDNDRDLDILVTGSPGSGVLSSLYRNDGGGAFAEIQAGLPGVMHGSAAWGDYDNDGDLDVLLTGQGLGRLANVYRNDGGAFIDIGGGLPGVADGSAAWGDYDNDGDLDIVLVGDTGSAGIARVYRNDGIGVFTDIGAGLPGVRYGSVAWGDHDNDGDLDLALTGEEASGPISRIYRNDGSGVFADIGASLPGVRYGSVAWGDYDNDGDLDLLLTGTTGSAYVTRIYRNDAGVFGDIHAALPDVGYGLAAWGDYDNDGDLDIALTGATVSAPSGSISGIYRNDGGVFADDNAGLPGAEWGTVAWGDYDKDGALDLLLTGGTTGDPVSRVYRNIGRPVNTVPTVPVGLMASVVGNFATLSWTGASDGQTPTTALSYNLRIGTTPLGGEVMSAMAVDSTGWRRLAQLGNVQQRTSWRLKLPEARSPLYWSVQAVDGGFAGGPFAPTQSFGNPVAVEEEMPQELLFALAGANPVMHEAHFRFGLPARAHARLEIHDVSGRRVATLVDEDRAAGYHAVSWAGRGAGRPAGVYFARLSVDGQVVTRKFVVLE